MTRWKVQATMSRGSKTESKPTEKKEKNAGPKAKPVDLHVKKPKVAAKPSKPSVPVEEHSD